MQEGNTALLVAKGGIRGNVFGAKELDLRDVQSVLEQVVCVCVCVFVYKVYGEAQLRRG